MDKAEMIKIIENIERTLMQISTKGQDSFFMVASLNSLRDVREELKGRQNGQ